MREKTEEQTEAVTKEGRIQRITKELHTATTLLDPTKLPMQLHTATTL